MNISISLHDLISIASSDNTASCGCLSKYPAVIDAIKAADPSQTECVVIDEFGQTWCYHTQEYIEYRRRMEEMDKELRKRIETVTLVNTKDVSVGFPPEVLAKIRELNPSLAAMLEAQK